MQLIGKKQQKLLDALEALNDILVSETKKGKEKRVVKSTKNLTEQIENIFRLEQSKFEELMLNPDSEGDEHYSIWDNENYSKPFTFISKIFFNLYQTSMLTNTQEISLYAAIGLNHILKLITPSEEDTKEYIHYAKLLEVYFSYHRKLFEDSIKRNDPHSHQLAYRWYTGRVFVWYDKEAIFNIDVLPILDKFVFNTMLYAIKHGNREWFKEYLSWMHHGIGFQDNLSTDLYEFTGYDDYEEFDVRELSKLDDEFEDLYTRKALDEWKSKFEKIKVAVLKKYPNKNADEIIYNVYQQHLFLNLKQMIHGLSAYLIYLRKYNYIKELWTFKQPDGSSSNWIGHSIIPENIVELIRIFPVNQHREYCFQDEHVDCTKYRLQYEVLYMAYLITSNNYMPTTSYTLSTDDAYLSGLKHYVNQLASNIDDVFDNGLYKKLGIKISNIYEVKSLLHEIVQGIKDECEEKIQINILDTDLDDKRIETFKVNFVEAYRKSESIKKLLKVYNSYSEDLSSVKKEKRFGINQLAPKDVFNSRLVMGVDMFGSDFARNMISNLRKNILDKMIEKAENIDESLSSLSAKINPDNIILLVFQNRGLIHNKKFEGAWRSTDKKIEHPSFEGWYLFEKIKIPIFRFHASLKDQFLVLDKTRLPHINQYSPDNLNNLIEEFYIAITDMKDKPDLIDTIISRENITEEQKETRKIELNKKVQIEIYESFDVSFDNYIGYILSEKELV